MITSKLNKGLRKIKWLANDLVYGSGIVSVPTNYFGRRILIYHGVTANAKTNINSRFISVELFEKQIRYIKENYQVVSLADYIGGSYVVDKLTVAITFDDGYRNNLTEVLPILEKYKVPATFFITTVQQFDGSILWPDALDLFRYTTKQDRFVFNAIEYKKSGNEWVSDNGLLKHHLKKNGWKEKKKLIDKILQDNQFIGDKNWGPYHRLLSKEEITTLSKSEFAEIGSHGLYHNCLTEITEAEARNELLTSKKYLEDITQKEVVSFAYPDGVYNQELINCAEEVGYKNQLIVDYNSEKDKLDPRIENRLGINPYISMNNQMLCLIDGKY